MAHVSVSENVAIIPRACFYTRAKVFTREDLPGWQTSYVESLYKDREGALWLVSRRGTLTRYHEGRFETYDWTAPHPKRVHFYDGQDGGLWVSSGDQIVRIAGKAATVYPVNGEWRGGRVKGVHEDEEGRLWMFSTDRLLRKEGEGFMVVDSTWVFHQIANRKAGGVWAATNEGLFHFKEGHFTASSSGLAPSDSVTEMHEDGRGRLWMGTFNGQLISVDGTEKTVYTSENGLPRGSIGKIYEQSNGRLWVKVGGHDMFYLTGGQFEKVGLDRYQSPPSVSAIYEGPEGNLWVGMGTGLFRLSPRTIAGYTRADGLPADLLFPILQDDEGAVWMGTNGGGLHRLGDGQAEGPKMTITAADGLPGNAVYSLHESREGGVWVGVRGSLARVVGNSVKERYPLGKEGGRIRALHEDGRGAY